MTVVASAGELLDALATADDIEVDGPLSGMPAITLRPGTRLRGREERPYGFGVDVLQGAFTLWNRSDAAGSC
jgi:hypothetical protein